LPAIRAGTAPCEQGFVVAFGALARPVRVSEAKAAAATRMGIVSASIKGRGLKGLPVMWKTKDGKHSSPGQSTLKTLGWRPLDQRCQTLFGVKRKVCRLSDCVGTAADAGFAGVGSHSLVARTRVDRSRHGSAKRSRTSIDDGGSGNRTRVRSYAVLMERQPPRCPRLSAASRESRPKRELADLSRVRCTDESPPFTCLQLTRCPLARACN
jgi:hypothetical protein